MLGKLYGLNFRRVILVGVIFFVGLLGVQNFVSAQGTYQIKEKIPGQYGEIRVGEEGSGIDTLQEYLEAVYKFGIAIVAILAVVMIGVGGFMYIVTSAGNAGKLADAKSIITSALVGLVMALLSWLILFVINPDLVGSSLRSQDVDLDELVRWVNDGEPDAVCNIEGKPAYERGLCSGDYVCLEVCLEDVCEGQCVHKKSFCTIGGLKIEGVCDESEYIAQPGQECGIVQGDQGELSGSCVETSNCPVGWIPLTAGKQCANSICCTRGL